ncbi:MAG: adenylate/guanylate cyclase domain-containing protein [Deltaproteobacteria bacterium]|nr:adenylate/guanylate cyclase domain-containing protein [Deltaproteobacteria bacterium]
MKLVVEKALTLKLHAQGIASNDVKTSIETVAAAVERQQPDLSGSVAPDGMVTLMFSDMEGFTAMTERLGDSGAFKVIQAHNAIVREQLRAHGGHELELQGDGFLLGFAQPLSGVRCAIAIQRAFAGYSAEHREQPIRVRIGLHCGQAIKDRDKFFGRTVILAARIAAQATGGEILVSAALKDVTQGASGLCFDAGRSVELKGIATPQRVHGVAWP